jgi:hypothetical protein
MIKLLSWVIRIAGLCALLLGMSYWLGPGIAPLSVHMTLGGIVALVLAILAVSALFARVRIPAAIAALLWAAVTVLVGTMQDWWVGAGSHLVIEVIHPVLGIGAIGLAEMLGAAINRAAISRPRSLG